MSASAVDVGVGWPGRLAVLVAAALAFTQAEPPRSALVAIEFRATLDGVPVADLRPDDVTVRVDGADRAVHALDLIRLDGAAARAPYAVNVGGRRGRDVILAIDEESFPPGGEPALQDALAEMMRLLTPRDRAGLVSLHPSGPSVPLGAKHAAVTAAMPQIRGRAIGPESATDRSCRTRRLLPAISSLTRGVDGGVSTTVLLFSAALAAPSPAGVPNRGAESACLLLATDFDEFRAVIGRSAAQLYAIHLANGPRAADPSTAAGLERLAGEAGGRFFRITGDPTANIRAVAADMSSMYVASVLLPVSSRRAAPLPVVLRVRREGVAVRFRPAVAMPAEEARTVSPRDMLRAAGDFRDLPLRFASFVSRGDGAHAKVVVMLEPIEPAVTLALAMVGVFNARGQLVAQWSGAREELTGHPVIAGLMVEPGTYRVRVAAVDALGRSGAVDDDVRVDLPPVGTATTSAVVPGIPSDKGFLPRLQYGPDDPSGAIYIEVYGVTECSALTGTIEVRATDEGPALVTAPAVGLTIDRSTGCIVVGEFDLGRLPPADYSLRLELRQEGAAIGQRVRVFRKSR